MESNEVDPYDQPRKAGRPHTPGTWAGSSIDRPGYGLGWSDGVFTGDPLAVKEAVLLCDLAVDVPLTATGPHVPADAADSLAAWAVARLVLRGRAVWTGDLPPVVFADDPTAADGADLVIC